MDRSEDRLEEAAKNVIYFYKRFNHLEKLNLIIMLKILTK